MAYFRTRPSELWPLETRRPRGARRQILSYAPRLGWLEARTLLAGTFVPDLTAEAVPLALGSPLNRDDRSARDDVLPDLVGQRAGS